MVFISCFVKLIGISCIIWLFIKFFMVIWKVILIILLVFLSLGIIFLVFWVKLIIKVLGGFMLILRFNIEESEVEVEFIIWFIVFCIVES